MRLDNIWNFFQTASDISLQKASAMSIAEQNLITDIVSKVDVDLSNNAKEQLKEGAIGKTLTRIYDSLCDQCRIVSD